MEKSSYVSKWREEGSSNLSLILKSTGSESFGSALSSDGNVESLIRDLSTCSVDSKEESSCLSTGSSEVTTTASRSKLRNQKSHERVRVEVKKKESSRSSSIRRRANDILEFLSSASASEVQIRQILGNTPDTSKALRMYALQLSSHTAQTHLLTQFHFLYKQCVVKPLSVLESVDYSYRLTVLIKPSATMQVVEDEGSKEVWHGGKT